MSHMTRNFMAYIHTTSYITRKLIDTMSHTLYLSISDIVGMSCITCILMAYMQSVVYMSMIT